MHFHCFAVWVRYILLYCPQLYLRYFKMLIVISILIVLYILLIIFKAHRPESLFKMHKSIKGHPRGNTLLDQIHPEFTDSNGNRSLFLFTAHNGSHNNRLEPSDKIAALQTLNSATRTLCPAVPPNLTGPIKVLMESPSLEELEKKFSMLRFGGQYSPTECQARDRLAIIVPYREREEHLRTLLLNLHPLLQRQQLNYAIYIVEQAGNDPFNRATLMNVGFVEALKLHSYDCFIFHDVDLLPEDDRNLYTCPKQPRHMSVSVDVFKYKLPYPSIFGGVIAMTKAQFQKVNGFSNKFWGWGGEDDDMSNRVKYHGYYIARYPANVGRYKMLAHTMQHIHQKNQMNLEKGNKRFRTTGLINLHYKVKEVRLSRLFTRILVELTMPAGIMPQAAVNK